ncbi:MAG: tetratricopeptide repeat protein [Acidobacteriota bacterium]
MGKLWIVPPLIAATIVGCADRSRTPDANFPITTSSASARKLYVKGRDAYERLRPSDAVPLFEKAIALDPDFALAHLSRSTTAPKTSDRLEALRRAVELADRVSEPERHLIFATEASFNGLPEIERTHLEALVSAFPSDARILTAMGHFYFQRQEWSEAIGTYRRAIATAPDYPPPYNMLGYALKYSGEWDDAEAVLRKYAQLIPDEPNPHDSYAELLMNRGKFDEAIRTYSRALDLDPNFAPSYIGIGIASLFLERPDQARESFTKLAFIAKDDRERRQALTWLAASFVYEGRTEDALAQVARRREIATRSGDLGSLAFDSDFAGEVLLDAGRLDEAQASFERCAIEAEDASLGPLVLASYLRQNVFDMARVALARGDLEEARRLTEKFRSLVASAQIPDLQRQAHALEGLLALASGDARRAVSELEASDQGNPRNLHALGQARLAAGNRKGAVEAFERATQYMAPDISFVFVRPEALARLRELNASPAVNRHPPEAQTRTACVSSSGPA